MEGQMARKKLYPFPVELSLLFCYNTMNEKYDRSSILFSHKCKALALHLKGGAA